MYRSIRTIRIILALAMMLLPAWALVAGYESVFSNLQMLTALLSGSLLCLVFWLLATFVYGRIYCSAVCPLGTTMDCAAAVERILSRRRPQFRYRPPMTAARWIFFGMAVVFVFVGGSLVPTLLDPYTNYARMVEEFIVRPLGLHAVEVRFTISTFSVAAATFILILLGSWRRGRILCNTVCPVGTLLSVPARRTVFHPDINTDKCINCGECERVCKCECIDLINHTVDTSRCVVCFDCMAVCPNGAITYRSGRHTLGMPLMQAAGGSSTAAQLEKPDDSQKCSNETVPPAS